MRSVHNPQSIMLTDQPRDQYLTEEQRYLFCDLLRQWRIPALAVYRHWNLVDANTAVAALTDGVPATCSNHRSLCSSSPSTCGGWANPGPGQGGGVCPDFADR